MHEYALTETDHEVIEELARRATASKADGVVSWWSPERGILWLRLFVVGQPGPWMMVPAREPADAARQREVFCQLVGIQLEINSLVTQQSPAH